MLVDDTVSSQYSSEHIVVWEHCADSANVFHMPKNAGRNSPAMIESMLMERERYLKVKERCLTHFVYLLRQALMEHYYGVESWISLTLIYASTLDGARIQ